MSKNKLISGACARPPASVFLCLCVCCCYFVSQLLLLGVMGKWLFFVRAIDFRGRKLLKKVWRRQEWTVFPIVEKRCCIYL